jgi:hypothetical protein
MGHLPTPRAPNAPPEGMGARPGRIDGNENKADANGQNESTVYVDAMHGPIEKRGFVGLSSNVSSRYPAAVSLVLQGGTTGKTVALSLYCET